MKKFIENNKILISISFFAFVYFNAFSQPFRYTETIFEEVDTLKNVEYANGEWLNNPISFLSAYNIHDGENTTETRPLYIDIFMPKTDTITKRPAIIFSHSGAFLIGSRHNEDMVAMCDSFARKGFVTTTIDYRLGMGAVVSRVLGIIVRLSVNEENAYRAAYRCIQDSRAAIRFLKHNADEFGIDSSKIFLVGSSAGGIQTLSTLYINKESEIPEGVFASPSLGGLDMVGIEGSNSMPAAAVSLWGAVLDTEAIEDNNTPLLLIHGEDDEIVPFRKGIPLEGNIPENPIASFNMPETYGSFCIDTALNNRGVIPETYFVENKNHEFYGVDTGEFPPEGPNEYWDTIQHKITDFLFDQICPAVDFDYEINGRTLIASNKSTSDHSVFWDFGDGNTSTEIQTEHSYEMDGEYTVSLTVCNENLACDTTSKTINIITVHNSPDLKISDVRIYPTPASNKINVTGVPVPFDINIYNLTGQLQLSKTNISTGQVDITSLTPGIYITEIKNKNTSTVCKFTKQRP
ncbi:PKD domain-containing protein [Maribellus maritimus]|uniref:PKD domain-containing protein n=1 Tax=Maribellus maritimus TaxID=2870838 RepID=UPI001EEBDFB2|nr:PKD domain-containing protein [Maribellus maritimus]MCG6190816.1 carboxylesterase family protein [Maribellus maritimus]